ncbi:putative cross-wall-targeting lipoprotein signal domain-containing proteiin [Streptococcus pluranimalium]|uniref:putative cross-wall-targeting lipoprotein signal domain-containing proteiin n=1 Tax=Streptococcus pluranimalium TaxID=82348 RepID=UPI0039FD729E
MNKNMKTTVNGHGFFRKSKAYGLVCGIALGVAMLGAGSVSADEVTTPATQPATEVVAPTPEAPAIKSDIPTAVPADTTQDQAVTAVDEAQATLKDNVKTATETGVIVKEGETQEVVINDASASDKTSEVLTDLNKQDQAVKEATAKQADNLKAYEETTTARDLSVSEGQANLATSTSEVDKLMEQAKKAGLLVTETTIDMTPEYADTKGLTGDDLRQAMADNLTLYKEAINAGIAIQGKSVEDLKRALALYSTNQKAYTESKTARDLAVSEGQSTLKNTVAKLDEQIAIAKKNDLAVKETTTNNTPQYKDTKGLTGEALKVAMAENIKLYNEAVKVSAGLMDQSTAQMKKQIDAYILALADYKKGIGTNTGLKWQNGVTLTAGVGAQKMTGAEKVVNFADGTLKSAAMYATQSNALDQNTDANFNNIFKINGSGTIYVKNTTNGDVTLTFSEINSPGNTGTYVAVWGADNGGIAWSVFATYTGGATGGVGESAGGGTGIGGAILNYVYSYKVKAVTANDVSVVTFNDLDVEQSIKVSGLDGATIEKGKNISGSGTNFTGTPGEETQASAGKLDSNGVGWTFDDAKKQNFTFVHSVPTKNTSIVGGIFGVASEKPKEPKKPTLEAKKATVDAPATPEAPKVPSVAVEKVTVEAPEAPEAPKPIEVDVHYYKMTKTPTPEQPTSPTPSTPVQGASVATLPETGEADHVSSLATALGLMTIGFVGFGLKKKKEEN